MAKKRKKKKLRIPKKFISIDEMSRTTYIQSKKTGKMMGRKKVKAPGDRTHVRRVKEGQYAGIIIGRTTKIKVRGSRTRRGGIRKPVRRL